MNPTQNSLMLVTREKVSVILNYLLAQCLDLQLQAKQAHWNVKGSNFIAIHELFDDVHQGVEDAVDTIAERIVQLGGTALGTIQSIGKYSDLPKYPTDITSSTDHLIYLSKAMAQVGKEIRESISKLMSLGDEAGADILIETTRAFDKSLWFVESHLQN